MSGEIKHVCDVPHEALLGLTPSAHAPKPRSVTDQGSDTLSKALDALMYEDGTHKNLTLRTLKLIEEAMRTGLPDAYMIKGLQLHNFHSEPMQYYQEAQRRGCTHPLLDYLLGQQHHSQRTTKGYDISIAMGYFDKAIASMLYNTPSST